VTSLVFAVIGAVCLGLIRLLKLWGPRRF
jgi:hypothetical protein